MRLSGTKATAIHQYRGLGSQLWDLAGVRPSLDLPFADQKSLIDGTTGSNLVDFTRASSGTYVGSDRLIKTATTNLWQWSNSAVDGETWNNVGVQLDLTSGQADPAGGTTAIRATDADNTVSGTFLQKTNLASLTTGATVSYSIWLKPISCPNNLLNLFVYANGTTDYINAVFTVSGEQITGTGVINADGTGVVIDSSVTPYPNGWYRCVLTGIPSTVTMTDVRARLNLGSYQRVQGTARFDWYGAQLEQSSTVGEYIPTTSTINSAPRFDHDPTTGESLGLLVEEERTNLLMWSEDFRNTADAGEARPWLYSNASITSNAVIAPDGSLTGDKLKENASTAWHYILGTPVSFTPQVYSFSIYAKAAERSVLQIVPNGSAFPSSYANFDLSAGIVSASNGLEDSFIIPAKDGWYRCVLVDTATATVSTNAAFVACYDSPLASRASSYTGDGTSGIYIWGAQLEAGAFPTSYIKTVDNPLGVIRSADVASITGTNFSSWYNQDEGTVFALASRPTSVTQNNRIVVISDGTLNNRLFDIRQDSSTAGFAFSRTAGSSDMILGIVYNGTNLPNKLAVAQELNNANAAYNGTLSDGDTSVLMPSVNQVEIGSISGTGFYGGTIRRLCFWPTRLPNEVLQTITL